MPHLRIWLLRIIRTVLTLPDYPTDAKKNSAVRPGRETVRLWRQAVFGILSASGTTKGEETGMADQEKQAMDVEVVETPGTPKPEDRLIVPARHLFPKVLPLLPLPSRPVFPGMVIPLAIDDRYQPLIQEITRSGSKLIGLALLRKREPGQTDRPPAAADFYATGTIAEIVQAGRPDPQSPLQLVVAALGRFTVEAVVAEEPFVRVEVRHLPEPEMDHNNELKAYAQSILSALKELLNLNPLFKEELRLFLSHSSLNDPGRLAD